MTAIFDLSGQTAQLIHYQERTNHALTARTDDFVDDLPGTGQNLGNEHGCEGEAVEVATTTKAFCLGCAICVGQK